MPSFRILILATKRLELSSINDRTTPGAGQASARPSSAEEGSKMSDLPEGYVGRPAYP